MYPSGQWDGFWEQTGFGRQSMLAFHLSFQAGVISGEGKDIIGRFIFDGLCDPTNGRVRMVKKYLGKHTVLYEGEPDGEGCIFGTWHIGDYFHGPFLMRPVRDKPEDHALPEIV